MLSQTDCLSLSASISVSFFLCPSPRCLARCAYGLLSAVFLCVNVVCAALGERGNRESGERTWTLVLVRVLVNDLLFILEAVCLVALLLLLTRHSRSTTPYLNSKVH